MAARVTHSTCSWPCLYGVRGAQCGHTRSAWRSCVYPQATVKAASQLTSVRGLIGTRTKTVVRGEVLGTGLGLWGNSANTLESENPGTRGPWHIFSYVSPAGSISTNSDSTVCRSTQWRMRAVSHLLLVCYRKDA